MKRDTVIPIRINKGIVGNEHRLLESLLRSKQKYCLQMTADEEIKDMKEIWS